MFSSNRTVDVFDNDVSDGFFEASSKWAHLSTLLLCRQTRWPATLTYFPQCFTGMTALKHLQLKSLVDYDALPPHLSALPTQLETLDLYGNKLHNPQNSDVDHLSLMTQLKVLNLSWCDITAPDLASLTPALSKYKDLTALNLSGNHLMSLSEVAALVPCLPNLQVLVLNDCYLTDNDVMRFVPKCRPLRELNIVNSRLGSQSIQALAGWPHLLALEKLYMKCQTNVNTSPLEVALGASFCLIDCDVANCAAILKNNRIRQATLESKSGMNWPKGSVLVSTYETEWTCDGGFILKGAERSNK